MNYRIEQREAFEMFGVYGEISIEQDKAFAEVPKFCKKCDDDQSTDVINALLDSVYTRMKLIHKNVQQT